MSVALTERWSSGCGDGGMASVTRPFRFLAISGSLRRVSLNRALLRAGSQYLPAGADFKILDIGDLPLYNEDLVVEGALAALPLTQESEPAALTTTRVVCAGIEPETVQNLRRELHEASAVLISACQYNFSISAALKNVIDWSSVGVNEWEGKPVAMMAAGGGSGAIMACTALQTMLLSLYAQLVVKPRVNIKIHDEPNHFDFTGALPELKVSSPWRKKIQLLVQELVEVVKRSEIT